MRSVRIVVMLLILAWPWVAPHLAAGQESLGTDDLWWGGFPSRGAVGPLDDTGDRDITGGVVYDGSLLVAGHFRYMDAVPVTGLARWTGETWEPFEAAGLPPVLTAMTLYEGALIVGGDRDAEETTSASCLNRWTGTEWEPIGPDDSLAVRSRVERLKVAGGRLYAILTEYGPFETGGYRQTVVTRWDGATWDKIGFWEALIEQGLGRYSITIQDVDEYLGDPVVALRYPSLPVDSLGYLYRWTGSDVEPLGGGVDDRAYSLCVYDGRLFVAGEFDSTAGKRTGPVAAWNGSTWEPVGKDLGTIWGNVWLSALYVSENHLYAYGGVSTTGGEATGPLLTWTGSGWAPSSWYYSDCLDRDTPGFLLEHQGKVIYGGLIGLGGPTYYGLATWDGEQWLPFRPRPIELIDEPTAILPTDEGLVVAGRFSLADVLISTRGIARWDGAQWTLLAQPVNSSVYALAEYNGRLVAGGSFYRIDGADMESVAQLVDGQWKRIGNGFPGTVTALEVYDGRLVAGGYALREAGSSLELIAAWDGLAWQPLGGGLHGDLSARVLALETYGGKLIAAGPFDSADGLDVENIAAWDGHNWSAMGPPGAIVYEDPDYHDYIEGLHAWRGRLYAQGRIEFVSGEPTDRVGVWNGEAWAPFENPLLGPIDYVGSDRDGLIIAGQRLRTEGNAWYPSLALFDGQQWYTLASSVTRGIPTRTAGADVTTAAEWRGSLYLGGDIRVAGNRPSGFLARWEGVGLAPRAADRLRVAPNPALESSTLEFRLDGPGHTAVHVFDVQGRRVRTLHDGFMTGGDHTATWDLRDDGGRRVPAGMYFLRVASPFSHATEKVVVIR